MKKAFIVLLFLMCLVAGINASTDIYFGIAYNVFPEDHYLNGDLLNLRIGVDISMLSDVKQDMGFGFGFGFYFLGWLTESEEDDESYGLILCDIPLRVILRISSGEISFDVFIGAMVLYGYSNWEDTDQDSLLYLYGDLGLRLIIGPLFFEVSYELNPSNDGYFRFCIGYSLDESF